MAIATFIFGIILTVIGMIDGLVAFWVRLSTPPRTVSLPANVVKTLHHNGNKYHVTKELMAKFGAKCFADDNGVPINVSCIKLLQPVSHKCEEVEIPSYIKQFVPDLIVDKALHVADSVRDIDSQWDDVNQIVFGTGMIAAGFGLLLMGSVFGMMFIFYGAYKVM